MCIRDSYKVVRIKDSEVKRKSSYDLTPDSPKPDTDWRDEKSGSKLNPLVDATDHKKNHKSGGGILSWIKSLTASPQPKKTTKKKSPQKRRPRKGNYKKKNANSSKSRPNRKTSSSKNARRPSSSKRTGRPSKSADRKPKTESRTKDTRKKAPSRKPKVEKDTPKKISGRQDIVKEPKKKPEPPTRALNDPRDN